MPRLGIPESARWQSWLAVLTCPAGSAEDHEREGAVPWLDGKEAAPRGRESRKGEGASGSFPGGGVEPVRHVARGDGPRSREAGRPPPRKRGERTLGGRTWDLRPRGPAVMRLNRKPRCGRPRPPGTGLRGPESLLAPPPCSRREEGCQVLQEFADGIVGEGESLLPGGL